MAETVNFNIPLKGRFVSGSLTEKRSKDHEGKPIEPEDQRYEYAVAYPKGEFWAWLTGQFWTETLAKALAGAPHALQLAQAWFGNGFNGFSMKMDDGDKPNRRGGINENTKSCFVVYFSAMNPPQCVIGASAQALTQIDAAEVKRGYYVMASGTIKFNEKSGAQIGIYVNGSHLWLLERGPEILGGVDAATAFAGLALPPGVTPIDMSGGAAGAFGAAPGLPPMPGMQPAAPAQMAPTMGMQPAAPVPAQMAPAASPVPGFTPPGAPQQTAYPGSAPAVQPYYGAMQPGQPPAQAPAAAPVGLPGLPPLPGQ